MPGEVPMVGNIADRLYLIISRACRSRDSETFRSWLETVSSSSNPLSCESPKISHHLLRSAWSAGCAVFQPSDSLKDSGGCSLKLGVMGVVGFEYLGPIMHPLSRRPREQAVAKVRWRFTLRLQSAEHLLGPDFHWRESPTG